MPDGSKVVVEGESFVFSLACPNDVQDQAAISGLLEQHVSTQLSSRALVSDGMRWRWHGMASGSSAGGWHWSISRRCHDGARKSSLIMKAMSAMMEDAGGIT